MIKASYKKQGGYGKTPLASSNPDVVYGQDFEDDVVRINAVTENSGQVAIRGEVISLESRDIHTKKGMDLSFIQMDLTDYTGTVSAQLFLDKCQSQKFLSIVKRGIFLKVKGIVAIDSFSSELSISCISGIKRINDFRTVRVDDEQVGCSLGCQ